MGVLALATAAVAVVSAPLAGRRRNLPTTNAVMIGLQVGMHVLFHATEAPMVPMVPVVTGHLLATGSGLVPLRTGRTGAAGMAMGHVRAVPPGAAAVTARTAAGAVMPWMAAGHLLAALAVSWLLCRCDAAVTAAVILAEAAVSLLAVVVVRLLTGSIQVPAVAGPRLVRPARDELWIPGPTALLVNIVVRRGPPRGRFAANLLAA
ncbi:hypothetical protein [Candidatus Frankia nodulisporulans]|nr:hypothetical protein [Candidatus Frankia nodulisporulans]